MSPLHSKKPPATDTRRIGIALSSGIRKIHNLCQFVGLEVVVSPREAKNLDSAALCVLTWGRKPGSAAAVKYAREHQLPVWYLEDGWIRNCDETSHSRKTYSLLVDKTGVYYDSAVPSDLENFLNQPDSLFATQCTDVELLTARTNRNRLIHNEITKYNYCKNVSFDPATLAESQSLVLVIDQTANDVSVSCGGMNAEHFRKMLDAAIAENPESKIVVRTHPDVVSGRRSGYLVDYAKMCGVEITAEVDNPIQWLNKASRVYVGTSQMGYEALLCGCEVVVFGRPFYAGWGLTDDRISIKRRCRQRSVDQLFYACHMWLARYVCPISAEAWSLSQCLDHVIEQKRQFARNAHHYCCVGITPWKRRYLARYLRSPNGRVRFSSKQDRQDHEQLLTWSYRDVVDGQSSNMSFRVEDGFIRSQGLGSDFVAPASIVIDGNSLYFDRHAPSDLECLLNTYDCTEREQERARLLRHTIVTKNVSKYNVRATSSSSAPREYCQATVKSKLKVLIIGQVEDDASIARGCSDVNTNTRLIQSVRKHCPDACLFYKPHPDVESGNRRGGVDSEVLQEHISKVLIEESVQDCIASCDELHTMTSLTGFEALLREKKVVTYGLPFYAGWGLTEDRLHCERRIRHRTLDELVYLTLIAYPRYLHIPSGEFIKPETLVQTIIEDTQAASSGGQATSIRWLNKLHNISRALRYAA